MARPRLPARIVFLEEQYCIRDGTRKVRLGLGKGEGAAAEARLESYLTAKRTAEKPAKGRRADRVSCAEVLDRYLERKTSDPSKAVARPVELAQRVEALLDFWGEKVLDDVDEDTCGEFVTGVGSPSYGRRCLEDFRAAVQAYARAGYLRDEVKFTLPRKPTGRVDWLTFKEACALCRTAWGYREIQRGRPTGRWPTRHVAKFVAVAIDTCSRSARIYEAGYVAEPDRPWIDLVTGGYYRQAPDEKTPANKRAPTVKVGERMHAAMRRWSRRDRYVCEWAGRPADPKKAFNSTVERARKRYPTLFMRPDGSPKVIVRHTLRHTGITWLALQGVDPYQICKFAGITLEVFERVYSHYHPDHLEAVGKARAKKVGTDRAVTF